MSTFQVFVRNSTWFLQGFSVVNMSGICKACQGGCIFFCSRQSFSQNAVTILFSSSSAFCWKTKTGVNAGLGQFHICSYHQKQQQQKAPHSSREILGSKPKKELSWVVGKAYILFSHEDKHTGRAWMCQFLLKMAYLRIPQPFHLKHSTEFKDLPFVTVFDNINIFKDLTLKCYKFSRTMKDLW